MPDLESTGPETHESAIFIYFLVYLCPYLIPCWSSGQNFFPHIYIFICIHMQDEVSALYVYATTTTIGTNTQMFFLIAYSWVSELGDCKSALKKKLSHTTFKSRFGRVIFFSPYKYIYGGKKLIPTTNTV